MEEKLTERIKNHLKKHRTTYVTGGICLVVGAVLYKMINDTTNTSVGSGQNNSQTGLINYWFNHSTVIEMPVTGHRGEIVFCEELKQFYPSISAAARTLGVSQGNLSKHLAGHQSHVGGYHFISLGENLNGEVAIGM